MLTTGRCSNYDKSGCFCSTELNCSSFCSKYNARYKKLGLHPIKLNKPIKKELPHNATLVQTNNYNYARVVEKYFPNAHKKLQPREYISSLHYPPVMRPFLLADRQKTRSHFKRYMIPIDVAVECGIDITQQPRTGIEGWVYAAPNYTEKEIEEDIRFLEGYYEKVVLKSDDNEYEKLLFKELAKTVMGIIELPQSISNNNNKQHLSSPDRRKPLPNAKRQGLSPLTVPSNDNTVLLSPTALPAAPDYIESSIDIASTNTIVPSIPLSSSTVEPPIRITSDITQHTEALPVASAASTGSKQKTNELPPINEKPTVVEQIINDNSITPRNIIPEILESGCITGTKTLPLPNSTKTLVGLMNSKNTPLVTPPSSNKITCIVPFHTISRWSNRYTNDAFTNGIQHSEYGIKVTLDTNQPLSKQLFPINILHNKNERTKASARTFDTCFKKQSRYESATSPRPSNSDNVPEDYMHCIETVSQTTVYIDKKTNIVYCILGDLIDEEELVKIKEKSLDVRSNGNIGDFFGVLIAILYEQKRDLRENQLSSNEAKTRRQMPARFTSLYRKDVYSHTETVATTFLKNISRFDMNQLSRIPWSAINVLRKELDGFFKEDYQHWRSETRQHITEYCITHDLEVELVVDVLDFIIMAHSQEQKDDQSFELGTILYDGGYCIPHKFMEILRYCKYNELYEHLGKMLKPFSMQNQKAFVHFSSMFLTAWVFDGVQPIDKTLMSYMQIGKKKYNVLNCISKRGVYTRPGIDVHVENWGKCNIRASGGVPSTCTVHYIFDKMPEFPGAILNDALAQIGQILHRGDDEARAIVEDIFQQSVSIDASLRKVFDHWKNMYGAGIDDNEEVVITGKRIRKQTIFYY